MKLKEFMENLNEFIKENPEALELDVIYSKDDEGNGYQEVNDWIGMGQFDYDDFIPEENYKEEPEEYDEDYKINAVCIN